ncbi:LOW QUALITY PROTEIN: hypothetical protein SETIT_5G194400v2 [Setaria italica]|uniref:Uncharacterized protein n=1 Tax=Setaria italica TaxID=4555 RepID=A0A368R6N1_SETIT|nr:LOW QUALITY PROTEIN: hypothetical protein SETIT_5G194400v2 [Setaria italica]
MGVLFSCPADDYDPLDVEEVPPVGTSSRGLQLARACAAAPDGGGGRGAAARPTVPARGDAAVAFFGRSVFLGVITAFSFLGVAEAGLLVALAREALAEVLVALGGWARGLGPAGSGLGLGLGLRDAAAAALGLAAVLAFTGGGRRAAGAAADNKLPDVAPPHTAAGSHSGRKAGGGGSGREGGGWWGPGGRAAGERPAEGAEQGGR